jgi:hypothetical protein
MPKKSRVKKLTKRKTSKPARPVRKTPVRRKHRGVSIKLKRNPEVLKRLVELGVSVIAIDEKALSLFFELERQARKRAELAVLYDAAIQALSAAILSSDEPVEWMKAARQAAGLPSEDPEGKLPANNSMARRQSR